MEENKEAKRQAHINRLLDSICAYKQDADSNEYSRIQIETQKQKLAILTAGNIPTHEAMWGSVDGQIGSTVRDEVNASGVLPEFLDLA